MEGIFIAAAKRSPIGKLNGALTGLSAAQIGAQVIRSIIDATGIDPGAIDDVIMGQVLQGGTGQNPARQAAMGAGVPASVPAVTLNMVCGAGQRSIHFAVQAIRCGDADLVIAGGQDSMTDAPHFIRTRQPTRTGDQVASDMMITDGLWDAFNDIHMGATVEQLARRYQVTREEQDRFALSSQDKARAAIAAGHFQAELTPVTVTGRKGEVVVDTDEHPRPKTTYADLAAMRPAFAADGTITAGNASGLNDGASAVLVGSETRLRDLGLEPMARIAAYASAALDPMDMGLGPAFASRRALQKAGWRVDDLDVLEINEAFAAQAIAVNREMGWDPDRINPLGGAIALGHPLAGSGNRIVVTLLQQMMRKDARRGLASLCIGGGQGVAICLER